MEKTLFSSLSENRPMEEDCNGFVNRSVQNGPNLQQELSMSFKKIACCTDFSENAELAFTRALDLAEKYGATLYDEPRKALILKIEDKMQQTYGVRVGEAIPFELVVLDGHVTTEILKFVQENGVDLLVVGSYGLSGMGLVLFGSVANRLSHHATCTVMIVRGQESGESAVRGS
jgi:universal stress protein A